MSYTASVITISDRSYDGTYADKSGPMAREMLAEAGYEITNYIIIPDEKNIIKKALIDESDAGVQLIVTTGGTGFAPRDVTPEATTEVIEKPCPGIAEYMRYKSMEITPRAMLSRGVAGIRKGSLIINLPGSPKAVEENLSAVLPHLTHGLDMLSGKKE